MTLYYNTTRLGAIVTIRILTVQDPKNTLSIGTPSAMVMVPLVVGVCDLFVGPGESIKLGEGVDAQFLAARGAM